MTLARKRNEGRQSAAALLCLFRGRASLAESSTQIELIIFYPDCNMQKYSENDKGKRGRYECMGFETYRSLKWKTNYTQSGQGDNWL